jgi:hypothetical protein
VGCGSKLISLGGLGCGRQYNIKMDLKEIELGGGRAWAEFRYICLTIGISFVFL